MNRTFLYLVLAQDGPLLCETNPKTDCWDGTQVLEIEEEETFTSDNILDQSKTYILLWHLSSIATVSIDDNPIVSFNRSELIQIAIEIGKVAAMTVSIIIIAVLPVSSRIISIGNRNKKL